MVTKHILDFPGGYTRSVGPVIGRFLSELRDGRLVGVRTQEGRVLFPPLEYDPANGHEVTAEFVEVGPSGTVESFAWVPEPLPSHPLDRPFAWALIRPDGADTAILHALDLGEYERGAKPPKRLKAGLRVRPEYREERTGEISDLKAFRPEVSMVTVPVRLEYDLGPGGAQGRFLEGVAEGKILGHRCEACDKVIVPMSGFCAKHGIPTTEEVEVAHTGTVTTFAVNNLPDPRAPEVPFVSAYVLLDGADVAMLALVAGAPADQIRMGTRVKAVWKPREEWGPTITNIRWFEPTGEPDVPFEAIEEYL